MHPHSLAAGARGADRCLGWLILLTALLLALGWTLPIMTVDTLLFFKERISILRGVAVLWAEGHVLLFVIVFVFSVVFPALKLIFALYLWYRADAAGAALARTLGWMEAFGRWSMLDVFVVALTVVAVQISLINDVTLHAGLYLFTAAIVLSIAAVQRITALARRAAGTGSVV